MAAELRKGIKISGTCLFGCYVAALVYFLFFAESYGRGAEGAYYSFNIYPFQEIRRYLTQYKIIGMKYVFLNMAGNVIGFMPFGALLPLMVRSVRKAWKVTLLGFEISALVEISQLLFRVGCFDIDDTILNTSGVLLGYALFRLSHWCYCKVERTRGWQKKDRSIHS